MVIPSVVNTRTFFTNMNISVNIQKIVILFMHVYWDRDKCSSEKKIRVKTFLGTVYLITEVWIGETWTFGHNPDWRHHQQDRLSPKLELGKRRYLIGNSHLGLGKSGPCSYLGIVEILSLSPTSWGSGKGPPKSKLGFRDILYTYVHRVVGPNWGLW